MSPAKKLEIESRIATLLQERGMGVPCHEAYELLYPDQVPPHYFAGVWEHVLAALPEKAGARDEQAVGKETPAAAPAES